MKKWTDFEAKKVSSGREPLPVGGYVCEIKSAKEENGQLVMAIDVVEGQYAGFWKKDYDNNDREDRKWRGTFRLWLPKDDGSEMDAWTKRTFGGFIWSVQDSNPGYTWDWDEKKLKGKKVGIIYRNREWEMNGNTGWTTEAGGSASVEDIRSGNFRPLKDRPLKNRPAPAEDSNGFTPVDNEDDLPFES